MRVHFPNREVRPVPSAPSESTPPQHRQTARAALRESTSWTTLPLRLSTPISLRVSIAKLEGQTSLQLRPAPSRVRLEPTLQVHRVPTARPERLHLLLGHRPALHAPQELPRSVPLTDPAKCAALERRHRLDSAKIAPWVLMPLKRVLRSAFLALRFNFRKRTRPAAKLLLVTTPISTATLRLYQQMESAVTWREWILKICTWSLVSGVSPKIPPGSSLASPSTIVLVEIQPMTYVSKVTLVLTVRCALTDGPRGRVGA
mmetsp:Transcript_4870/g.8995  ORF Transcript_4870/g.8995 Transcript_4870/m.8995 type:complete len:259 (+) Transcript_4870:259-1035(+)